MSAPYPAEEYPGCPCYACDAPTWPTVTVGQGEYSATLPRVIRTSLCPSCGARNCPAAADHTYRCLRYPAQSVAS